MKKKNDSIKLIIAGSRYYNDLKDFEELTNRKVVDLLIKGKDKNLEIISGGARGVDSMARIFANLYKFKFTEFPADWELYGRNAGVIRNIQMANYGTHLLAFWDGKSKGTGHMIRTAERLDLEVDIIYINEINTN